MATIKYRTKGKNELSTIYVRLRDGRKTDIENSTGYLIEPKYWSESNGKVKQTASNTEKINLTNNLENLQRKIIDSLNEDKGNGTPINSEWLNLVIQKFKNPLLEQKTDLLIGMIEAYKVELSNKVNQRTKRKTASATLRNFNTTISRLKKFEESKKTRFNIHQIDLTFHSDYIKFATNKLGLSINSIGKDLRQIKTVCLDARDKGFEISKQLESRKFNAPSEPSKFVTLNELELEKIKKHKFKKETGYLDNARDWLIIGCWTGCRVNDLMKLTKNNILMTPQGQKFIRYTQSKTSKQVDIPIHEDVNEILERLNDFPRSISDVKFNEYIKKVCKVVGLITEVDGTKQNRETHKKETGIFQKWELIRSHTCRRSFATNHYNKLSNKIIMAVTGHATERMLLNYIGETENDHLEDFLSAWNNDKKEKIQVVQMEKKSV
jgi:integrase